MFKIIWNHSSLRYHCHDQFLQMEILVLMQVFHLTTYVLAVCTYENKNLLRTLVEVEYSFCTSKKNYAIHGVPNRRKRFLNWKTGSWSMGPFL